MKYLAPVIQDFMCILLVVFCVVFGIFLLCGYTISNETLPKVNGYRTYDLPESTIVCRIEDMRPVKCFLIPRGSLLLVPSDSTNER